LLIYYYLDIKGLTIQLRRPEYNEFDVLTPGCKQGMIKPFGDTQKKKVLKLESKSNVTCHSTVSGEII